MSPAVHPFQTDDPRLHEVHNNVVAGKPLSAAEVTALFSSKDILAIGWLANFVRERRNGHRTLYRVDRTVSSGEAERVVVTGSDLETVCREAEARAKSGMRIAAWSVEQTAPSEAKAAFQRLRSAGVESLIGDGVELFHPSVRRVLWASVARSGERAALRQAATEFGLKVPLYSVQRGASPEQQASEILSFRDNQAEAFTAVSYDPDTSTSLNVAVTTGMQEMKQVAIARLTLDHVEHVRAYWEMLGGKLVQIALRFGVSYLDGSSIDNGLHPEQREKDLAREINVAGREPEPVTSRAALIVTV